MNIISQVSFGKLYLSENLKNRISQDNNNQLKNTANQIQDFIKKNDFDKKKNVDIILGIEKNTDKFYTVVSPKLDRIPDDPKIYFFIDKNLLKKTKQLLASFKEYIDEWDNNFSKKFLEENKLIYKNLQKFFKL